MLEQSHSERGRGSTHTHVRTLLQGLTEAFHILLPMEWRDERNRGANSRGGVERAGEEEEADIVTTRGAKKGVGRHNGGGSYGRHMKRGVQGMAKHSKVQRDEPGHATPQQR
jgi:hypothetical protein